MFDDGGQMGMTGRQKHNRTGPNRVADGAIDGILISRSGHETSDWDRDETLVGLHAES